MKNKILFGIMALVMGIWATGCSDDDYAINQQPLLTDNSVVTGSADVTATSATLHVPYLGLKARLQVLMSLVLITVLRPMHSPKGLLLRAVKHSLPR